jgi:hypothetical protein
MSILHSQLAIYGAIDDLVLQAREGKNGTTDRAVLAAAAKLLPNSTGFGEAGWYRELEQFINRKRVRVADSPLTFPGLGDATAELIKVPAMSGHELEHVRDPNGTGGFEAQTAYNFTYDPVLARAGYGAFALLKLGQIAGWDKLDKKLSDDLRAVLSVAVRSFDPLADDKGVGKTDDIMANIDKVNTRQDWTTRVEAAVSRRFAADSKPCFGTLEEINGKYCSTVVTDTPDPGLSVVDIEEIVDPMNWSICSKFFCKMSQNKPNRNSTNWSRVREEIGAECGKYHLTTDLIFYKVRQLDGSIFINYDIDPDRKDPGYVEVDNGYIYVSPDNDQNDPKKKGVRIRTSKQEHVNGLSPCATAALACLMGWADAGKEMLAGTARKIIEAHQMGRPTPKLKAFYPSDQFDPGEQN